MTKSFAETLDETVGFIERALSRIERRDGAEAELHNVRAYLLNALELIVRDPGIEAAADDLFAAASAFVGAQGQAPPESGGAHLDMARQRPLRDAFLRFRAKLGSAVPNEQAQHLGLS